MDMDMDIESGPPADGDGSQGPAGGDVDDDIVVAGNGARASAGGSAAALGDDDDACNAVVAAGGDTPALRSAIVGGQGVTNNDAISLPEALFHRMSNMMRPPGSVMSDAVAAQETNGGGGGGDGSSEYSITPTVTRSDNSAGPSSSDVESNMATVHGGGGAPQVPIDGKDGGGGLPVEDDTQEAKGDGGDGDVVGPDVLGVDVADVPGDDGDDDGGGQRGAVHANREDVRFACTFILAFTLACLWAARYTVQPEAVIFEAFAVMSLVIDSLDRLGIEIGCLQLLGTDAGTVKVAMYWITWAFFAAVGIGEVQRN